MGFSWGRAGLVALTPCVPVEALGSRASGQCAAGAILKLRVTVEQGQLGIGPCEPWSRSCLESPF